MATRWSIILHLYLRRDLIKPECIPYLNPIQEGRVRLDIVPSGGRGSIGESPRFCKLLIHYFPTGIQPDNGDTKEHEQHVDRNVGAPLEAGRWVHAAAVKDGARLTLYLDGVARGATAVPAEVYSDARTLGLGGNPHFGGNESLPGKFSDLRLYSRALSQEEVQALAR